MRNPQSSTSSLARCRAELFRGLYDHRPRARLGKQGGYRLLNGVCREEDATSRRFAHIEIDDDRLR